MKNGGDKNENGEEEPKYVKSMDRRKMEKVFRDLGCTRVWNLCNFDTVEDNLGHMYNKSSGLCRFQMVNGTQTRCEVRIEFDESNNKNKYMSLISMDKHPHTHPSPILNAEGVREWQWNTHSATNSRSVSPQIETKVATPIVTKLQIEATVEDFKDTNLEPENSSAESTTLVNSTQSLSILNPNSSTSTSNAELVVKNSNSPKENAEYGHKSKEILNEQPPKYGQTFVATKVRKMNMEEQNMCFDLLDTSRWKNARLLVDDLGFYYEFDNDNNQRTFMCKFAKYNGISTGCNAFIDLGDQVPNKGWIEVIGNGHPEHSHPNPTKHHEQTRTWLQKLGTSTGDDELAVNNEESHVFTDESRGLKNELLNLEDEPLANQIIHAKVEDIHNSLTVRIMNENERSECYRKLGKMKKKGGTVAIDSLGHIYGPRNATFRCKFLGWKEKYGASCPARINSGTVKQWSGWRNIGQLKHAHNHASPFHDPQQLQGSQSHGSNQCQTNMTSSASLKRPNPSVMPDNNCIEKYVVGVSHAESGSEFSPEMGEEPSENKRRRVETAAEDIEQGEMWTTGEYLSPIESFDASPVLSRFTTPNPTEEPEVDSIVASSLNAPSFNSTSPNTLDMPNSTLTSSVDPDAHLRHSVTPASTPLPDRKLGLPAWTNCTECKACVLIDAQSKTKDLIAIAKHHINLCHAPTNKVNKKMILNYFPYIINLREVEQMPVAESLSVNDEGDFVCAIANCNARMMNMIDESNNDNDLINHVINQHLASDEIISDEKFWQCFPITGPRKKREN